MKQFFEIIGYIIAVGTVIAALWALFLFVDSKLDKDNEQTDLIIQQANADRRREINDSLFQKVVLDSLCSLSSRTIKIDKRTNTLEKSYIRFVNDNVKNAEVVRSYMEGITWELKKNTSWTVSPGSGQ
jgi:hypothetical protein